MTRTPREALLFGKHQWRGDAGAYAMEKKAGETRGEFYARRLFGEGEKQKVGILVTKCINLWSISIDIDRYRRTFTYCNVQGVGMHNTICLVVRIATKTSIVLIKPRMYSHGSEQRSGRTRRSRQQMSCTRRGPSRRLEPALALGIHTRSALICPRAPSTAGAW
jgi:hypothetical protein